MGGLIGARIPRLEDGALLVGKGRFVDDIALAGVWHAAFVRSPHPHAAIRRIDGSDALALPGVHAVLTLDDLAPVLAKRRMLRHSNSGAPLDRYWSFALADGEVSFVGEPAAIVLAESRYVAEDAAAMVAVDYDVLASVGDARRAIEPTAPAVRRELNTNIAAAYKIAYGDIDAAFAAAAYVFHEDLWQHRGGAHPIEGRGILAEWREDSMTVWASTQKAHDLFQSLTALLDFDESRLRVATPDVGGGFGPKLCVYP
jgi:carbon-monoxide dehydrogenase large subunit